MVNYRKEIDGLRGLSIIFVVLFHANFFGFEGGYIGVDIFFTISGYLITSLILQNIKNNSFNLKDFYLSRTRRILPAYIFILTIFFFISLYLYNTNEIKNYANISISSIFFYSNILFSSNLIDYFFFKTINPLLHTWSLSVVGQYYLLFPFMFILFKKKKNYLLILITIAIISFLFAQFGGNLKYTYPYVEDEFTFFAMPQHSFFNSFSRAWEIILGCLSAFLYLHKSTNNFKNLFLDYFGFILIIASLFFFKNSTVHPSIYTFGPTVGTILIILFLNKKNFLYKLLTSKTLVFFGLISYSLYLWHYPILEFYKFFNIYNLNFFEKISCILLSIIFSVLTFKFIEKPFRNKKAMKSFKFIIIISFSYIILLTLLFFFKTYSNTFETFNKYLHIDKYSELIDPKMEKCWYDPINKKSINDSCVRGNKQITEVLLIGDSHAGSIAYSLEKLFYQKNKSFRQFTYNGCIPTENENLWGKRFKCKEYYNEIYGYIKNNNNIKKIIFIARWPFYFNGDDFLLTSHPNGLLKIKKKNKKDEQKRLKDMEDDFIKYLNKLDNLDREIVIIKGVPEAGINVPTILSRAVKLNKNIVNFTSQDYFYFLDRNIKVNNFFNKIEKFKNIQIINISNIFCNINKTTPKCIIANDLKPYYFDHHHLNLLGADYLVEELNKLNIFK